MSDQSTTTTARGVDTDVTVIVVGRTRLVMFGAREDPVANEKGCPRP